MQPPTRHELTPGTVWLADLPAGTVPVLCGQAQATLTESPRWLDGVCVTVRVPLGAGAAHRVTYNGWVRVEVVRAGALICHAPAPASARWLGAVRSAGAAWGRWQRWGRRSVAQRG